MPLSLRILSDSGRDNPWEGGLLDKPYYCDPLQQLAEHASTVITIITTVIVITLTGITIINIIPIVLLEVLLRFLFCHLRKLEPLSEASMRTLVKRMIGASDDASRRTRFRTCCMAETTMLVHRGLFYQSILAFQ